MTAPEPAAAAEPVVLPTPASPPTSRDWLLVTAPTVLSAVVALVAAYYLAWRAGAVPLPVTALGAAAFLFWAPRACFELTHRLWAAAAPALAWFVVTVWMGMSRPELYRNGTVTAYDWRLWLLLGLGVIAAAWSIGSAWGDGVEAGESRHPGPGVPVVDAERLGRSG